MRQTFCILLAIAVTWVAGDAAAEIHKCEDADGGIVFQQTPCPAPAVDAASDDVAAADEPDEPTNTGRPRLREGEDVAEVIAAEQDAQLQDEVIEACKQEYRDAIDAIDLEIKNSYTADQREYYLRQLKALTDKMRAC